MFFWRLRILASLFLLLGILVVIRLFYWQVIIGDQLKVLAESQYFHKEEIPVERGHIFTKDSYTLVANKQIYNVYAFLPQLNLSSKELVSRLSPFLGIDKIETIQQDLTQRLDARNTVWVPLFKGVDWSTKEKIEDLKIAGLNFEGVETRLYPEGSMSAHLLGFVGQDSSGQKGYFGLEGFYDRVLSGRPGYSYQEKDASGKPILIGDAEVKGGVAGRDIWLNIDRRIQFIVEDYLKEGMEDFRSKGGSVVVMDPKTGDIIAMTSLPSYQPGNYSQEDRGLYSNPAVSQTFEPGSILKPIIMAAAVNEGLVKPDDRCTQCDGPRRVGEYMIRTWDEKYHPNSTMMEILEHSDNVGMVFVSDKLGQTKLISYLKKFGLDEPTGIDLEGEATSPFRNDQDWGPIELATASFGQGVAVTPIQLVRAISVIANGGFLVEPHVVAKIRNADKESEVKPKIGRRVISETTAKVITEMMVDAAEKGGKWERPKGFRVAGKTGTAQVPIAGHYDKTKTIVSFIGFAPVDDPKFVMLVTLREPALTWGGMTAAPLWMKITGRIMSFY